MTFKLIGAMIVILGCGGCGFLIAVSYKRESAALHQLKTALDFMYCELKYRLTPLPELCILTAAHTNGQIKSFFTHLSRELEQQISPDVKTCVDAALSGCRAVPVLTNEILLELGKTLGCFDLDGQLQSLSALRDMVDRKTAKHSENLENRLRSYQTLGLCAGAALAILFI